MRVSDIGKVLNEWDEYKLQGRGFKYGESDRDLALLNDYLQEGRKAHWGKLQAVEIITTENSCDVVWDKLTV